RNEDGELFGRCSASRERGSLPVLVGEIGLPEALPHTGRLPALRVAGRNGSRARDGRSSRAVLRRLLLAIDAAFVRRRRDERSMVRRACRSSPCRKSFARRALARPHSRYRTRSLRWRLGRRPLVAAIAGVL